MTAPASGMEGTAHTAARHLPGWRRGGLAAAALVLVISGALIGVQRTTYDRLERETAAADQRTLEVYQAGIVGTLDRYPRSVVLLAQDPRLTNMFAGGDDKARAERLLSQYVALSGAVSAFVLDRDGNVAATSEGVGPARAARAARAWAAHQEAVQATLTGRLGRAFGPVPTDGERLYFFGRRIGAGGDTLGMLVVAVAINELELLWRLAEREVLVVDANGVVVLSSEPGWRLRRARGAGANALGFDLPAIGRCDRAFDIGGSARLCRASRILHLNWDVYLLSPTAAIERRAWIFALEIGLALLSALLIAGFGWQRLTLKEHTNKELQRRVKARTGELEDANTQLRNEITSRITKEQELRKTQDELVQAGKMGALGQMAAGLVHELNQPLSALRTYNDNTTAFLARDDGRSAAKNLGLMGELIDRMARISAQLKAFARRTPLRLEPVELQPAIEGAIRLVRHAAQGPVPALNTVAAPAGTMVIAEPVRLQQVLVNLIRNAVDAIDGDGDGDGGTVTVTAEAGADHVRIHVRDDGSGIGENDLAHIFDPFFTSKADGRGMGLGLSISQRIAEEFGGSLHAANQPGGGSCFTFVLRRRRGGDRPAR